MHILKSFVVITAILLIFTCRDGQADSSTMNSVLEKGFIQCGVHEGLQGFSLPDANNNWKGIDVDLCRAVAAAVLKDPQKVRFTPLSADKRFQALKAGNIDILSRNTTWTITRDTNLGVIFAGIIYYDGQGFIVNKNSGVRRVEDLNGSRICVQEGTTSLINLGDYFRGNGMQFSPIAFGSSNKAIEAYDLGHCESFTTDQSQLFAQRGKLKDSRDHAILPKVISKDPLGPVVRQGDDGWLNIVKWTLFAMLNAEELGITSKNIDQVKRTTKDPRIHRLLGLYGNSVGTGLGLDKDWAYRIIKQVGNYEEIFENNLGKKSQLQMSRGLNALWSKGGLQYAPPIR
ncbi:MAG: amino acid ABC transporter substrate-binding protein [Magnetococcales bacterium]|nr:amino acid ABC transporter substrate-binding protein [Magnetococcales bacterium]